jgi:TPR repeat protein
MQAKAAVKYESTEALQAKAGAGDMDARRELAERDYQSWLSKKNRDTRNLAVSSLQPLAESGDSSSQLLLGYVLCYGSWYEVRDGIKWLSAAADRGNTAAMGRLGEIYRDSTSGVPKDDREARKWYRMAADRGYFQVELGAVCENDGDVVEALKWYEVARMTNFSEANAQYDRLSRKMSPEQIAEAHGQAVQFKIIPPTSEY